MPRVLLTGYGGFLGAEIARQLLSAGWQVRGVARGAYPELVSAGVEGHQADICDRESVMNLCKDCDAIIHTAAKAGVWGAWDEYYQVNTAANSNLLEAAHTNKVRAFVFTSSPSVTFAGEHQSGIDESVPYPEKWLCHYPHTKALAEQDVLAAAQVGNIQACALRPHLIWGEGDPHLFPRVIQRAQSGRLRRVGLGTNLIDTVHVRSAAWAHVQSLRQLMDRDEKLNGQALFLSDDQPVECWSWVSRILEGAGVEVTKKSISFRLAYAAGAMLEASYRMLGRQSEPPMTRFVAAQLALDHYFDMSRARELLGYNPEIDRDAEFAKCQPWLQSLAKS